LAKEQKGLSTINAISNLVNEVSLALDGSQRTMGVFCDLSKAFDCVNHQILLKKLNTYYFSVETILWLKSYLSNRYQRTVIKKNNINFKSQWEEIKVGVPQGSILGPLLFLLYINDLPKNVSNSLILYADDTTAVVKANTDAELRIKVGETLSELENWFTVNGLKLNQGKTQIIKFSTVQSRDGDGGELVFRNQSFAMHEHVKFLGINIDLHFTWGKCIEMILRKLNSATFQMLVLRNTIDLKTRLMVYYAYFYSILQYGIEIWGFASGIDKIFIAQKKFLRTMTFARRQSSCKPIFKDLKIMTVPSLIIFKTLLMVQSNYDQMFGDNFKHKYSTRYKDDFQYPMHRLKLVEKTTIYMGKKFFNNLPLDLKSKIKTDKFKSSLADYLLDNTFYSLENFLRCFCNLTLMFLLLFIFLSILWITLCKTVWSIFLLLLISLQCLLLCSI